MKGTRDFVPSRSGLPPSSSRSPRGSLHCPLQSQTRETETSVTDIPGWLSASEGLGVQASRAPIHETCGSARTGNTLLARSLGEVQDIQPWHAR
eukprot:787925-Rhodomonas_salina.1